MWHVHCRFQNAEFRYQAPRNIVERALGEDQIISGRFQRKKCYHQYSESRREPATGGGPHHAKHVSIGLRGWVLLLGRAKKETTREGVELYRYTTHTTSNNEN